MNILIYNNNSPYHSQSIGGGETSLKLLAEKLVQLGHEVTYLTKGNRNAFKMKEIKVNEVNVNFIPVIKNIKYLILPTRIIIKIDKFLFEHNFKKVLIRKNIDVIYAFYNLGALEYMIKKIPPKIRPVIIMRMAGLLWSVGINKNPKLKEKYKFVFNNVESINFISEGIKTLSYDEANKYGIDLDIKSSFVGDIGVEPFRLINSWKGRAMSLKLNAIVATRFSDYAKRQDLIVEALRRIKSKKMIKVTLIGNGPNRFRIQEKIKDYNLTDVITIIPFLPQSDLWSFMQNSDLLCHPCDFEGLSKIIIESMMMGLPVLASNVIPLNGYITDGLNGYLSDNHPDAWAEKLVSIYENKEKLKDISHYQISYAKKYYNANKNVLLYESEFNRLLIQHNSFT